MRTTNAIKLPVEDPAVFEKVVDSLLDALILVNPNATVRFANRAALELLGRPIGDLAGRPIGVLVFDGDLQLFHAVRRLFRSGTIVNYRLTFMGEGNEPIPVTVNGSLLRNESGGVEGLILAARDMREIIQLIDELEKAKEGLEEKVALRTRELESAKNSVESAYRNLKETQAKLVHQEKLASLGHLAAGVAHEINNPIGFVGSNLNSLRDYMKALLRFLAVQAETCRAIRSGADAGGEVARLEETAEEVDLPFLVEDLPKIIDESAEGIERVRRIVADLKEFSRAGESERKVADINRGIESTLNVVWNEIKYKANVARDLQPLPPVLCYPQELNQVFMNLFVNAAQAIDGFGEIYILTRAAEKEIVVEVSDSGRGMAPEVKGRIFDPFFTTKDVGQGTGLGLSISYGIVQKHGGRIEVESEEGKGTTFRVLLPIEPPEDSRPPGEPA